MSARAILAAATVACCGAGQEAAAAPVDFVREVRPIFAKHCTECHGEQKQKSGLRLDVKAAAMKGGDGHAPDIIPGNAKASPLMKMVLSDDQDERMPPKGGRLSAAEIAVLNAWIAEGAPWPDGVDTVMLNDKRDHWSFKPVAVAPGSHSIDEFIAAKLKEHGLAMSPAAPRAVWLRRVTFDLTGLPPTPEEMDAFAKDGSADAFERVVERLLKSERYGERWAQHWLDVVRYADTHGFEVNTERPNAWPYRDYVIRAFNQDTPYDRFIREQIVGDALGEDAATGFLITASVLLPDQIGRDAPSIRLARQDSLDEIVSNIGQTFLGLSIGCARCHDHKFDPIPQRDYYAMQAFVSGVEYADREMSSGDVAARKKEAAAPIEPVKKIDAKLAPPDSKHRATNASKTPASGPKAFAGKFRMPDEIHLLSRGDPEQPKEEIIPAVLSSLGDVRLAKETAEQDRRKALADWIASAQNPLTARVMVNRIWQGHFGTGLVQTPSDFGNNGMKPTHPELLDWLAQEFVRSGWSVKHLHRIIVLSQTYRQSSIASEGTRQAEPSATPARETSRLLPAAATVDADNRLLWCYPSRRIEAETIRDSMLAVSGQLNLQMYGRGYDLFDKRGGLSGFNPVETFNAGNQRRMIYAHKVRRETETVFGAFDCPDAGQSTALRRASTTPIQALNLFNSRFTIVQSEALAARVKKEAGENVAEQIRRAYQLSLNRDPSAEELRDTEPVIRQHGLATLCRAIFNSNEFLFLP